MTSTSGTAASEPPQILIEVDVRSADRVAVVTFRRGSHNYLSYDLVTELAETFEDVAYQGCRSVVLRTDGRHFCAGADFRRPASRETGRDIFDVVPRLFRAPIPVVAALTGASVGGGMTGNRRRLIESKPATRAASICSSGVHGSTVSGERLRVRIDETSG